jgi:alcohol dehydrogenase, propanol-preferring
MNPMVRSFGRPLAIEEVPLPTPGPGEVLVKIMASVSVTQTCMSRTGTRPVKPALPFIPGNEGAGIVSALGAGGSGLKEGDPSGVAVLASAVFAASEIEKLLRRRADRTKPVSPLVRATSRAA